MDIIFDPPNLREELSKALRVIPDRSGNSIPVAEFGEDLIDFSDPDFDPEEYQETVITRETRVSLYPPGADTSFETAYGELIDMLNEARWAQIDPKWRICLTPRRALLPVEAKTPESHFLAPALAVRGSNIEQEIDGRFVRVQLVSGLTVFGICFALSENYSEDYFPSVSESYLFIEIFRPYEINAAYPDKASPLAFTEDEARALATAFLYELNLALDIELGESSMNFSEEYPDEKAIEEKLKGLQLRTLLTGPGIGEVLRHYNHGVLAITSEDGVLAFAKVLEYVSATIVRESLIDRARQKLMSPRSRLPDSAYILELQAFFDTERTNRQDRAAIMLTIKTCCDAEELRHSAPECCRKLRELPSAASEKERDAALENFAECVVSTRNMLSRAKANFDPTGCECPIDQLNQLARCLRVAAQQVIHYFHGLHPDKRVV